MTENTMEMAPPSRELKTFTIHDPATGERIADYPLVDRDGVDRMVTRAREAFEQWSQTTFKERKKILRNAAAYMAGNSMRFAHEIAAENGKTHSDSYVADIFTATDLMHYYGKNAGKFLEPVKGIPTQMALAPMRKCYYKFEPKGVVGVISPWNFPFTLSAAPVTSAVAAGNAVILKPSSQTTRAGLIVKEALEAGGLPEGVVQVLTGTGSLTGQALIEHPGLDMLFFTGSTEVGREVNVRAAERFIPTILELGGKDAAIVTKNANLERAANGILWGGWTNCGQTCIGSELILVDRAVYETFLKMMIERVSSLELGKEVGQIGCMTMPSQVQIVREHLEDALAKGAKVVAVGKDNGLVGQCNWTVPMLVAGVTTDMKLYHEETFGPVRAIIAFDTIDQAIELANGTRYGLSASIYDKNRAEARRIGERIKAGSINVNDALLTYGIPGLPFGGAKESGLGYYHGKAGLQNFCDIKSYTEFKYNSKKELHWYPVWHNSDRVFEAMMKMLYGKGAGMRMKGAAGCTMGMIRGIRGPKEK